MFYKILSCKINENLRNKRSRENDKQKPKGTSNSEFELAVNTSAEKYNFNKEAISLEPCSTKNSIFKDSERKANNSPACSNGRN